jgi:hypothetical protein
VVVREAARDGGADADQPELPERDLPAQPVRTTSETAMIPNSGRTVSDAMYSSLTTNGAPKATSTASASSVYRAVRTSGTSRSSVGMGRNALTVCQVEAPLSNARESVPRRTSSATRMITSIIAADRSLLPVFATDAKIRTPMPVPA